MPDSAEARVHRYSAFVSYNRADAAFVRRLHRRLEGYRLPRAVAAASGLRGRRLKPLFRDRDELTAGPDLSDAVREALADSDFLIVICSPAAAASKWVAWEIELFRRLHGDSGILAALIEGDSQSSFPPPLKRPRHGHGQQPLAADFRPGGDGARMAFLKLVAPLAGARLDELIHRDAQRRMQQVAIGSGGALAVTVLVAVLAVATVSARLDAATQRNRTNGLSRFMLSDLRKGLQAAGRTDLLADVDRATLQAYPGEKLGQLTPEQLQERAKAQHALGEDSEKRGELTAAQAQFEAAWRSTATLLSRRPEEPQRIFAHAQSEYYVGFINLRQGHGAAARNHFDAYARLAARLVRLDPANDAWVMETAYAASNLGVVAMRQSGKPADAERNFRAALAAIDVIAARKPGDADVLSEKADTLAWLADSQRLQGHLDEAAATRATQGEILTQLMARDPRNIEVRADVLAHDLGVARIDIARGRVRAALAELEAGRTAALALQRQDPDNKNFAKLARVFELFRVRLLMRLPQQQRPSAPALFAMLGDCSPNAEWGSSPEIADFCTALHGQIRILARDPQGAQADFARALAPHSREVYSAQWGLDFREETRAGVGLAQK